MDQKSIIVVGAAHSLGDDSIVKLLEDKGYVVK
ncbi:TraB/GumN family protein [Paenibacillus terrae]|nr:TraB/GumN family protein [Paenibacillus terrae]